MTKTIRVIVRTTDGEQWCSDAEHMTSRDLSTFRKLLVDFGDIGNLRIAMDGHAVYFNPAHIVSVAIEEAS